MCTHGKIELYSGYSSRHGNVRICDNGTWYKVCGYGNSMVDDNLASVICSDLGYSPYGTICYTACTYTCTVMCRC